MSNSAALDLRSKSSAGADNICIARCRYPSIERCHELTNNFASTSVNDPNVNVNVQAEWARASYVLSILNTTCKLELAHKDREH
ncbi:hypothetical protein TRAPUB_1062 [Trametes pubescens]|uniref:Uncharacterized protein n=1 Tax=Trametes pubescens TaxID=154538 RepID=A0A1M2VKB9_TRAPU|nr:hypothetical protein TRAPUB_1062 [Trametes pubescens]